MGSSKQIHQTLVILHYLSPALVLLYFAVAAAISICTLQTLGNNGRKAPRKTILSVMLVIMLSYVSEALMLVVDTFTSEMRRTTTDGNIYALSSLLVWMVLTLSLLDTKDPVWYPYYGSWFLTLAIEAVLFSLSLTNYQPSSPFEYGLLAIQVCRFLALNLLPALLYVGRTETMGKEDEEHAPLLPNAKSFTDTTQYNTSSYGSTAVGSTSSADGADLEFEAEDRKKEQERTKEVEKRLKEDGNWFTYAHGFLIFLPYIWPAKERLLQLRMFGVVLCLLCIRALNVLVPRQLGIVINALGASQYRVPFLEVGLYVFYSWMASAAVIGMLKTWLWFPLEQYAYKSITTAAYNQIMNLSCDFHDSKQSGELYKCIEQGTSINSLFEMILFQMVPTLIDLLVAYAYFCYLFGAYMTLIVAATTIIYLWSSTTFNAKQSEYRRRDTGVARKEYQVLYDTVGSWTTVSYFNRLAYECKRYKSTVDLHMQSQRKYYHALYIVWVVQFSILKLGFFGACFLAVYQVVNEIQSVGSFATLISYWAHFTGPLSFFSDAHRQLERNLIDAEQLLQLFQRSPAVEGGSATLALIEGCVRFENVEFSYDGAKKIIKGLSFVAKPGQKIALIGETGGGKSTILKLLFRFYDVSNGSIAIDGQDIRGVTLASLRDNIGVVPQDPSLFNDTIMSNVRYSRLDATDAEIIEACKAAAVHEKILSFTEGYHSKVGERGVKLSGGELQRIAIARVILKDPKIILLDEATSSVDTETESQIQQALEKLTEGRTTFVVAHRLSTVVDADYMVVIKDGTILEQGSPKDLLKAKGKYYNMWSKQVGIVSPLADLKHGDCFGEEGKEMCVMKEGILEEPGRNHGNSTVKKWKPDAPEFIPQHLRGETLGEAEVSENQAETQEGHDHEGSSTNGEKGKRKRDRKYKNRADASTTDVPEEMSMGQLLLNNGQDIRPANETSAKRVRLNHSQRRRMAKSEPKGSGLSQSRADGVSEFGPAPEGSGQSSATANVSRQSSSLGDPPSGAATVRSVNPGQRRRRQRHWRIKNREASAVQARNQSTEGSAGWSTDSFRLETPVEPITSRNDVSRINERGTRNSSNSVHFVPDV